MHFPHRRPNRQILKIKEQQPHMNWDQFEGKYKQLKGSVRQQFGKFTDDDLEYIAGQRENLIGKLQERYGVAKEEAQKRADEWLTAVKALEAYGQPAKYPAASQPGKQQ